MATVAKTKVPNYTPEQEKAIEAAYVANKSQTTVEALAKEYGKSTRSVIAKLSRLGVYVSPTKAKATTGEASQKKAELASAIGAVLRMEAVDSASLEKASKPALQAVWDMVCNSKTTEGEGSDATTS